MNQKRMDDEAVRRYVEEEVRRETREAEMKRLRERASEAQATEEWLVPFLLYLQK
jgi:hypothetical protein